MLSRSQLITVVTDAELVIIPDERYQTDAQIIKLAGDFWAMTWDFCSPVHGEQFFVVLMHENNRVFFQGGNIYRVSIAKNLHEKIDILERMSTYAEKRTEWLVNERNQEVS